jgi:hypothetical protein
MAVWAVAFVVVVLADAGSTGATSAQMIASDRYSDYGLRIFAAVTDSMGDSTNTVFIHYESPLLTLQGGWNVVMELPYDEPGVGVVGLDAFVTWPGAVVGRVEVSYSDGKTFCTVGSDSFWSECIRWDTTGTCLEYVTHQIITPPSQWVLVHDFDFAHTGGYSGLRDPVSTDSPTVAILGNQPNPFSTSTDISFELGQPGHVVITLYDVAGRKVRTILDRDVALGPHKVSWDGTGDDGQRVAPGMYFYDVATRQGVGSRKVLIVR